jgi:CRISPR-associated protein Csd1
MILQSLYSLYQRLAEDPSSGLPTPGFSLQGISFKVVLYPDGRLHEICAVKDGEGRSVKMLMPGSSKPPGQGVNPCFLWDNTSYMLGYSPKDKTPEGNPDRTRKTFEAFRDKHLALEPILNLSAFTAVCRFLETWNPDDAENHASLAETKTGFGVFQIIGTDRLVHESPEILRYVSEQTTSGKVGASGLCLVTGQVSPLAKLHDPAIKGIAGAQSSGAKLVSFNLDAFKSYAKEQGLNAPVSEYAAFAYCSTLNHLLASERQRFRIGDATTVFWTDQPSDAESLIPLLLDAGTPPEDTALKQRLEALLDKASRGQLAPDDLGDVTTRYYILGLAPNASRLSVRFWHSGTLGDLVNNIQKHQNDLSMVRQWDESNSKNPDPKSPGIYALLRQTARDADGIPPLLGGALARSILLGTRYPDALFQKAMGRLRVSEKDKNGNTTERVTYLRAALIKSYLNRNHQKNIPMSLDPNRRETPYLLGRLFAALEKTQEDALGNIGATIRDRFYSAASATPATVFSRIIRTYQHHISKMDGGLRRNREVLVQEIVGSIEKFPAHLNLQDQGQFAIGYYHQRKDFFTKKDSE